MSTINELKVENYIIRDNKSITEELNKFFSNIGSNTERNLPVNTVIQPKKYLKNRNQSDFIIAHVSNDEIMEIIKDLEKQINWS